MAQIPSGVAANDFETWLRDLDRFTDQHWEVRSNLSVAELMAKVRHIARFAYDAGCRDGEVPETNG